MNGYILATAPPGCRLGMAVADLAEAIDAGHADVDQEIKQGIPATVEHLRRIGAPNPQEPDMHQVTNYLPRGTVGRLWREAAESAVRKLSHTGKDYNVLSMHTVYYGADRQEFYTPVNPDALCHIENGEEPVGPSRIVIMIDDVYDMYMRLIQKGKVFSVRQIEDRLSTLAEERGFDTTTFSERWTDADGIWERVQVLRSRMTRGAGDKILTRGELAHLTQGLEIDHFITCLWWRYLEMIQVETLGAQLELPQNRVLLWPIKQGVRPLTEWLQDDERVAIYVSHPISEPRRERGRGKGRTRRGGAAAWPAFVTEQVNQLPSLCADQGVSVVMPTGIDEYRLKIEGVARRGVLDERWPMEAQGQDSLYEEPDDRDGMAAFLGQPPHYASVFDRRYWSQQEDKFVQVDATPITRPFRRGYAEDSSPLLELVANEIGKHVSARDFFELAHSDGILVFRPYYGGRHRPSRGVRAELKFWERLARCGEVRRAAIVHFDEDLTGIQALRNEENREYVAKPLEQQLTGDVGKWITEMKELIRTGRIERKLSLLEAQALDERTISEWEEAWNDGEAGRKVREYLVEWHLAGFIEIPELDEEAYEALGLWVVRSMEEFREVATEVCGFLTKERARPESWRLGVDRWMPADFFEPRQ